MHQGQLDLLSNTADSIRDLLRGRFRSSDLPRLRETLESFLHSLEEQLTKYADGILPDSQPVRRLVVDLLGDSPEGLGNAESDEGGRLRSEAISGAIDAIRKLVAEVRNSESIGPDVCHKLNRLLLLCVEQATFENVPTRAPLYTV